MDCFVCKQDPGTGDGGTYRCHVKNEFGESNANLNLNIEAEPEPEGEGPTFVEKPRILSQNNGKLVIMECKVRANPAPEITWTKEGKIVTETSQIKLYMDQRDDIFEIRLELSEPNLDDSGLYKCNIKNNLGELNANLTLNIESELLFCFSLSLSLYFFNNLCFSMFHWTLYLFTFISKYSCACDQGQTKDH